MRCHHLSLQLLRQRAKLYQIRHTHRTFFARGRHGPGKHAPALVANEQSALVPVRSRKKKKNGEGHEKIAGDRGMRCVLFAKYPSQHFREKRKKTLSIGTRSSSAQCFPLAQKGINERKREGILGEADACDGRGHGVLLAPVRGVLGELGNAPQYLAPTPWPRFPPCTGSDEWQEC